MTDTRVERVIVYTMTDEDPDLSWLDQSDAEMGEGFEAQAKERLATYGHEGWEMVGIICEVSATWMSTWVDGSPRRMREIIAQASLWGIESDSDPSYLQEVAENMIEEARADLEKHYPLTFSDDEVRWEIPRLPYT